MALYALLNLCYTQHVTGTSMPIIRSSRLYVCYCRLWCAVLGCRGQVQGSRVCVQEEGCCSIPLPGCTPCCPAIKHTVTSSWFFFSTHMQWCMDKHTSSCDLSMMLVRRLTSIVCQNSECVWCFTSVFHISVILFTNFRCLKISQSQILSRV